MVRTEKAGSQAEKLAAEQMDALDLDDFLFSEGDDADILLLGEMMGDVGVPNGGVVQDMEFDSLPTNVIDAGDKSLTNQVTANSSTTKKGNKRKGSSKKNSKKNKNDKNDSGDSSKRPNSNNHKVSSSNFAPQNFSSNNSPKPLPSFEKDAFTNPLNNTNKISTAHSNLSETRSKLIKSEGLVASDKDKKSNKKKDYDKANSTNSQAPKSRNNKSKKKQNQQKLDAKSTTNYNANSNIGIEPHVSNSFTNNNNNVGSRPPPLLPTRTGIHFSPGISTIRKTGKLQRPNTQNQNIAQIIKPLNAQSSMVSQSSTNKKRQALKLPTTNNNTNNTNNSSNTINNDITMATSTSQKEQSYRNQQTITNTNKTNSLGQQSMVPTNHHQQLPQSQSYAPNGLIQQQEHYADNNHHNYGLEPSNKLFFPFLPLPKEVSMRRCNKMFPILDEIHNSVMEDKKQQKQQQTPHHENLEQYPLYQLLTDTNISNGPDNNTFHGSSYPPSQAGPKSTSTSMQSINQTKEHVLSKFTKEQIHLELESVLYLLNRQTNFLNQSLNNMKTWCKENFESNEYKELYMNEEQEDSNSINNKKRKLEFNHNSDHFNEIGMLKLKPDMPSSINSFKATTTTTVMIPKLIRVTLNFAGYNHSNNHKESLLFAQTLNPIQVPIPSDVVSSFEISNGIYKDLDNREKNLILQNGSRANIMDNQQTTRQKSNNSQIKKQTIPKTKKQQNDLIEIDDKDIVEQREIQVTNQHEPKSVVDLYADTWSNQERRAYLSKSIDKKINKHAKQISTSDKQRYESLVSREKERSNILKETDDLLHCNTFTMWRIMNNAMSYMAGIKYSDVFDELSSLWQPELPYREMNYCKFPSAHIMSSSEPNETSLIRTQQKVKPEEKNDDNISGKSLFNRLQSLLVDEHGDNDDEKVNEKDSPNNEYSSSKNNDDNYNCADISNDIIADNSVSSELDYVTDSEDSIDEDDMDVSNLSLDERAFIHLRALHLIDRPLIPSSKPVIIENEDDDNLNSLHETKQQKKTNCKEEPQVGNDIDSVIRSMQLDLSNMNRANNESLAFLQASANTYISEYQSKWEKKKENDAALLHKHAQLIKKQKESRNAAKKVKQSVIDKGWIPW